METSFPHENPFLHEDTKLIDIMTKQNDIISEGKEEQKIQLSDKGTNPKDYLPDGGKGKVRDTSKNQSDQHTGFLSFHNPRDTLENAKLFGYMDNKDFEYMDNIDFEYTSNGEDDIDGNTVLASRAYAEHVKEIGNELTKTRVLELTYKGFWKSFDDSLLARARLGQTYLKQGIEHCPPDFLVVMAKRGFNVTKLRHGEYEISWK
jgi:hypothetical protein